jgi:hypothetical protein
MRVSENVSVPLSLPRRRLWAAYLRGIREIIVLAFFLVFLGVVYQVCLSMGSGNRADW